LRWETSQAEAEYWQIYGNSRCETNICI
jgi:hypothetical protein